ncbi:precorrin-6B methylase [Metallosphaera hakonensis]|uniref:Precorrin-6B methylase n=1 Tax=Metallosphaera hakonensis JCM 8857 = DSM 7519 TaxID=1293036 RepID=A0A2U9IU99_9CREN|nr:precorrin-6B methylase [Metallosphaera hakonensis]AWR99629.1 precorrin-6B methylase [Metallosphaera hakonensis JCM 8857 = DSM 7519]
MFPLFDDKLFECDIPGPTKQEIRAIVLSKMKIFPGCRILEVGTGTGAVTSDLERLGCYVISLDQNEYITDAPGRKFTRYADYIQALSPWFASRSVVFDSIFIGGSEHVEETITLAYDLIKRDGVIVINAFSLDTLTRASRALEVTFGNYDVIQVTVSKAEKLGKHRSFIARNPVFIFYASKA